MILAADLGDRKHRSCFTASLRLVCLLLPAGASGCSLPQSTFENAGVQSEEVTQLFWILAVGAVVIWLLVMGTAIAATLHLFGKPSERTVNTFIIGAGMVVPTIVLAVLLSMGLTLLPSWGEDPERLKIRVHGEQWWWRVQYQPASGPGTVSANEIHMPAGEPVEFVLTSADVIHSFWIPAIGGKLDMIPGRETRLLLEAQKPGVYRGVCAEYCGTSHALMAFAVVVHPPEEFEAWLEREGRPADVSWEQRGAQLFLSSGCSGCHRIAGLADRGEVGPDLTHVGARRTIGAGIAKNTQGNLINWIADPKSMKPAAGMPSYDMLSDEELAELAGFLQALR